MILKLLDAPLESRGYIHHQSADAKVRRGQAPAGSGFDQVHDLFPLAEAIKENCHGADIERMRA